KIITTSHDSTAKIWDAQTGLLIQEYSYQDVVDALGSGDDSQMLFGIGYDVAIRIWQVGKAIYNIPTYFYTPSDYYSPKNRVMFFPAPRRVGVWDVTNNREMFHIDLPFIPQFMLWHPNG
ncbi:MAG TPA: WD40 repeat domain-containing protein, partial [Aggregatilineales bacterium]|nr:WD40 repeat domain-containing protein [Aggregatilineales bacterium]